MQKVLDATATVAQRTGDTAARRGDVMVLLGYSKQNLSAFKSYLSKLKQAHLITYTSETMSLTNLGREHAQEMPTESAQERLSKARDTVKGAKAKVLFDFLVDGGAHMREDCAKHLGYEGTKVNAFKILLSNVTKKGVGVVEYCQNEEGIDCLRLADWAFGTSGRPPISSSRQEL